MQYDRLANLHRCSMLFIGIRQNAFDASSQTWSRRLTITTLHAIAGRLLARVGDWSDRIRSQWNRLPAETQRPNLGVSEIKQGPTDSESGITMTAAESSHGARLEYARSRRGGSIGTDGRAVVMLRFDHWLVNFQDIVLPILRKHSLVGTLNINYDNIENPANGLGLITWPQVQDWNQYDGIEIANHGATHTNANTKTSIYHEVVDGRRNLEAVMPRVAVETWHEHGSAHLVAADIDGDIGLSIGREPRNYFDSYAGRLIMAEHAIVEGKSGGFFVNLNGHPQIGQSHMSIDRATADKAIAQVEIAKNMRRGVTLYLHPGVLNTVLIGNQARPVDYHPDGTVKITDTASSEAKTFNDRSLFKDWAHENGNPIHMCTNDLNELCAYLAAERDAGNIMVMTAAGGAFADRSHSRRENLLIKSDFTVGYDKWWSGTRAWNICTEGPEVTITAPANGATLSQGILLYSRFGWAMGATHEFVVRAKAPTPTSLTLHLEQMGNPANWRAERTHNVPGDNKVREFRMNVTLPRDRSIAQIRAMIKGAGFTVVGEPILAAI